MRALDNQENRVRKEFNEYFQKSVKPSNNGRDNGSLAWWYNDTKTFHLAEVQMALDHFGTRQFDPITSEKFHGVRCLEFIGAIERLGLQQKMKPLLSMYSTLVDRTVGLSWSQTWSEGGKEEDWFKKHEETISVFSNVQDWKVVMAHEGTWLMDETRSLLNVTKTFSGNLMFGDWKFKAVGDYMDEVSKGHLNSLEKEVSSVKKHHLEERWQRVLKEAVDREILQIYEEQRTCRYSYYSGSPNL